MTAYEITQHAIQLAPLLLVPALMYAFRRAPKVVRLIGVLVLGWIGVFLLVQWYWSFAIDQAPNQELAEELATRDGAPTAFAFAFGWLYVAAYMALIEGVLFAVSWIKRRRLSARAA